MTEIRWWSSRKAEEGQKIGAGEDEPEKWAGHCWQGKGSSRFDMDLLLNESADGTFEGNGTDQSGAFTVEGSATPGTIRKSGYVLDLRAACR